MPKHDDPLEKEILINKKYKNHVEKETRRKQLKSAQKNVNKNYVSKRPRRRDWLFDSVEEWDDLDYEPEERVMPRGEQERRQTLERAAFYIPEPDIAGADPIQPPQPDGLEGIVIEVSKSICRVEIGQHTVLCRLRGSLNIAETGFTNPVAVGDEVIIARNGSHEGVVETVLPRRSLLARPDVFHSHLRQLIVANADQLLIVSAWREPALWLELLDRYLIAAERNHLPVLICLNKMDLADDEAECQATLQPYRGLGYPIILTSTVTGQGITELRELLHRRTTVLTGLSGVGKSSLLTAVQPDLQLRVGEVSESSGEGRHTTTQAKLIRLDDHSAVIDTPGIREFGLSGLPQSELADFFPEIRDLATPCRFGNCRHLTEPDCAVRAAVQTGSIAASRYHSYQQIYATLPA